MRVKSPCLDPCLKYGKLSVKSCKPLVQIQFCECRRVKVLFCTLHAPRPACSPYHRHVLNIDTQGRSHWNEGHLLFVSLFSTAHFCRFSV